MSVWYIEKFKAAPPEYMHPVTHARTAVFLSPRPPFLPSLSSHLRAPSLMYFGCHGNVVCATGGQRRQKGWWEKVDGDITSTVKVTTAIAEFMFVCLCVKDTLPLFCLSLSCFLVYCPLVCYFVIIFLPSDLQIKRSVNCTRPSPPGTSKERNIWINFFLSLTELLF